MDEGFCFISGHHFAAFQNMFGHKPVVSCWINRLLIRWAAFYIRIVLAGCFRSTVPPKSDTGQAFTFLHFLFDAVLASSLLSCVAAMAEHGDWDDLFAKAADIGTIRNTGNGSPANERHESRSGNDRKRKSSSKNRRKNKRQLKEQNRDIGHDGDRNRMLQTRIEPTNPSGAWPFWARAGRVLYEEKARSTCTKWDFCKRFDYARCQNCGKSALHHRLEVIEDIAENKHLHWPLHLFAALRNIRCCAKFLIRPSSRYFPDNNTSIIVSSLLDTIQNETFSIRSVASLLQSQLPRNEGSLVESKVNDVTKLADRLLSSVRRKKPRKNSEATNNIIILENAIRLVIACDAVYYRLYYLQLTKKLPISIAKENDHNTKAVILPHPPDYFGLDFFTMDVLQAREVEEELSANVNIENLDNKSGMGAIFDFSGDRKNPKSHALASIYKCRWLETILIFYGSGWYDSSRVKQQAVASLSIAPDDDFHSKHETPAPSVLMEWRDSCRDFMCNLYSYATLSPDVIQKLCEFVKGSKSSQILEIGAGTGYLARLIQNEGINVNAWDIHPTKTDCDSSTNVMNVYHGYTPPFCQVKMSAKFPPIPNCGEEILLLCYPPPRKTMATDTLQAYLRNGGMYLIHIGEFKGLTGDQEFEKFLVRNMSCHYRFPCLTWGTDASSVTIWKKKDEKEKYSHASSVLLPCSSCNRYEATRRCRFLRNLVYCGAACFQAHETVRAAELRLRMIATTDILEFSNPRHFVGL